MAKYFLPRDTFESVERLYNDTKPLIRRDKLIRDRVESMDIRPTNDRGRHWERVVKINKNKYLLTNQAYTHLLDTDDMSYGEYWKFMETFAPIVWERKRDGTELLIVRNMKQAYRYNALPTSNMDFLYRHLPRRWCVSCDKGNQYLDIPHGKGRYLLPRNDYLPRNKIRVRDSYMEQAIKYTQSNHDPRLTFKRLPDGEWVMPERTYKPLMWRIDKVAKQALKPTINKFKGDAFPIMAMLKDELGGRPTQEIEGLVGHFTQCRHQEGRETYPSSTWFTRHQLSGDSQDLTNAVREELIKVLTDSEHEHWLGLIHLILQCPRNHRDNVPTLFNNWVNKIFNVKKKMEV